MSTAYAERVTVASAPAPDHSLPRRVTSVMAVACGLAVASVYYAHPLLDTMASDLGIATAHVGIVIALTQLGYGLGLVLLVPLGDRIDRRRLILGLTFALAGALGVTAIARSPATFLAALVAVGLLAVVAQSHVAHASALSPPEARGRTVATLTGGIVVGIVAARVTAGGLADAASWRAVYAAAAVSTLVVAVVLWRALPRSASPPPRRAGRSPFSSLYSLFAEERVLRVRGGLAFLSFAAMTVLWTPMALALRRGPHLLSHGQIGLFGLAGILGALGAARAGRLADRGRAEPATGRGLACMTVAWLAAFTLPWSLWGLILAVALFDFGLQSVHVANQALVYRARPDAQSGLTAAYMVCYSLGCGVGAVLATAAFSLGGWTMVCSLGAVISGAAIAFWRITAPQARP